MRLRGRCRGSLVTVRMPEEPRSPVTRGDWPYMGTVGGDRGVWAVTRGDWPCMGTVGGDRGVWPYMGTVGGDRGVWPYMGTVGGDRGVWAAGLGTANG